MIAPEASSLDEIARLLALLLRQQLDNQTQLILELSRLELTPTRIAELVGTTPATVRATLNQRSSKSPGRRTTKGDL